MKRKTSRLDGVAVDSIDGNCGEYNPLTPLLRGNNEGVGEGAGMTNVETPRRGCFGEGHTVRGFDLRDFLDRAHGLHLRQYWSVKMKVVVETGET